MDIRQIWVDTLDFIKEEVEDVNEVGYNTWIKPIVPVSYENGIMTLAVSLDICRTIVLERYKNLIENSLYAVIKSPVNIEIIIDENSDPAMMQKKREMTNNSGFDNNTLNMKYTFENFVVGNSNRYAHAVSLGAAESPAIMYNPLFLYGNSGLGKTHLMHAIGNHIKKNHPDFKILYISSERFTIDLINSIRDDKMAEFRDKYRTIDVLLVDDVQFIEGKESTQEEFFHTFNTLYNDNKQIVLTSDRKPKDLITLEERLRTRFEWGLTGDINPPDYETRIAILKKKAENERIFINDKVYEYIAERIKLNIRELEGALLKIVSYANISNRSIDIALADEALRSILPDDGIIKITSSAIKEKASKYYGLPIENLVSKTRTKEIALARQVAMFLCKELTDMSYVAIGREFGGRDHTTVLHAVKEINKGIIADRSIKTAVDNITKELHSL